MILSDRDLRDRLKRGDIKVEPLKDPEIQIQPASIDLRLGFDFQTFNFTQVALIDPLDPESFAHLTTQVHLSEDDRFIVHPGEFILATTLEHVEVPSDLVARLEGRSSVGRLGIVIHSTAGYIDPGFKGTVTLEISNLGVLPVSLYPLMRICQIAFEQMSSPVSEGYDARRTAKYQGQKTATVSRLFEDGEFRSRRG
jgi:dCTP deaminase